MSTGTSSVLEELASIEGTSPESTKKQLTLLSSTLSILQQQAQDIDSGNQPCELTLFEDPFSLLSTLCPLLRHSTTCIIAKDCLELVAGKSSAREMVLALGERFVVLCPIDYQEAGESDEDEEEETGEAVEDDWEPEGAVREFVVLVHLFSIVLPRISTAKPLKFLAPVLESFLSAIESLAEHVAFSPSPNETGIDALSLEDRHDCTVEVTNAVVTFIDGILEEGIWISSEKEKAVEELRMLLLSTISILHQSLNVNIAEAFFYTAYPRYRIPGRTTAVRDSVVTSWKSIAVTAGSLNLDVSALCTLSLPSSTRTSANSGAFTLLTHLLSASPNLTPSHLYTATSSSSNSSLLSRMLPNLISAFTVEGNSGNATKVGEDAALFFVWWCVQDELKAGGEIEDGILFTLVELLSTLSALSPSTSTRFVSFKLLSTLIVRGTQQEEIQFMIVKDLLNDCPFDAMKVASIGILKELLMLHLGGENEKPVFVSSMLMDELATILFRFEPVDLLDTPTGDSETTLENFLDIHYRSTIEKLGFLYFLLARDTLNKTTVRSVEIVDATRQHFLDPLRRSLATWTAALDSQTSSSTHHHGPNLHDILSNEERRSMRVQCEMLRDALDRVTDYLVAHNDFR